MERTKATHGQAANCSGGTIEIANVARPEQAVDGTGPDGQPATVIVQHASPAFPERADQPLSTFLTIPEGVTTAQELLDHLTLKSVIGGFVYRYAKSDARFAGATDA